MSYFPTVPKEAYAVCLKEDGKAIGAIELKLNGHTDMTDKDDECKLRYQVSFMDNKKAVGFDDCFFWILIFKS